MYALTQSIKETVTLQPGTVPRPQKPLRSSSIGQEPLRFSRVTWGTMQAWNVIIMIIINMAVNDITIIPLITAYSYTFGVGNSILDMWD